MTFRNPRKLSRAERFLWPDNFFPVTAAIGGAGLAAYILFQMTGHTMWAEIFGFVAIGLVFATIPHALIGLHLTLPSRRHILHCILRGLGAAAVLFGLFMAVFLLYGLNSEVGRTPDSAEASPVREMWGCGIWFFSLFGFLLGCWLGYRRFSLIVLPETRRKVLDL